MLIDVHWLFLQGAFLKVCELKDLNNGVHLRLQSCLSFLYTRIKIQLDHSTARG